MKFESVGGKFALQRSPEEQAPFTSRLLRIEGQVRGLRQMIEENRYCGDAMQQSSAIAAGIREVTLMLISQQVQAHVDAMRKSTRRRKAADPQPEMQDFIEMLRSAYRFQ